MEIGNHSFTHPEMDHISPLRTKLELDATQRVIEAMTGHMTTLWRAPNRADSEPSTEADFDPVLQGDKLGYLFIGEQIDPTDWKPGIKSAQIVANVLANANNGNAVLLHDAGGDTRAETIKALPLIIEGLKARGYTFVPVSALVGKPKSVLFPAVTGRAAWGVALDRAIFDLDLLGRHRLYAAVPARHRPRHLPHAGHGNAGDHSGKTGARPRLRRRLIRRRSASSSPPTTKRKSSTKPSPRCWPPTTRTWISSSWTTARKTTRQASFAPPTAATRASP